MEKTIVYSSVTGNTKLLAEAIKSELGNDVKCEAIKNEVCDADIIFVGFWTMKFSCTQDVEDFLKQLKNKKIFLFGTAGYDSTDEFFKKILDNVKAHIDSSNEIIGEFMSLGKVSEAKQKALKQMDEEKYNSMKANLEKAESHPNTEDLENLRKVIKKISII